MAFPQKLQEYRKAEKLSQEELADRLGVSRQSVSKWEQGLSFPETEKLIELSSLMHVSIDALLKEDALPEMETKTINVAVKKRWLVSVLVVLLIAAVVTAIVMGGKLKVMSNTLAEYSAELEQINAANDDLAETGQVPPEANDPGENSHAYQENYGFENKNLHDLQHWFLILLSSIVWTICRTSHRPRVPRWIRENICIGHMLSIRITGAITLAQ